MHSILRLLSFTLPSLSVHCCFPDGTPVVFTVPVAGRGWKMLQRSGKGDDWDIPIPSVKSKNDYTVLGVILVTSEPCSAAGQEALRPDSLSEAGDPPVVQRSALYSPAIR
jgi:hypothetical protein